MNFQVEPQQVDAFGGRLGAHQDAARQAVGYADRNLVIKGADQGLLQLCFGSSDHLREQLNSTLGQLEHVCQASSAELHKAASFYRTTDQDNAKRLDDTYPAKPSKPGSDSGPSPQAKTVGEVSSPGDKLQPPQIPSDSFKLPTDAISAVSNFLSPGYWTGQVLKEAIGVNPAEELGNLAAGDWHSFARYADTLGKLADFCDALANDVQTNSGALGSSWQGNAAGAAGDYFTNIVRLLQKYSGELRGLRDAYLETAKGCTELSSAAAGLVQGIFDKAFWAGVEVAAGAILAETGVGPALMWSLAGLQLASIVKEYAQFSKMVLKMKTYMTTLIGSIDQAIGLFGGSSAEMKLPAGYDHPGV